MTTLSDGLHIFVKRDCPTCELVVPVLEQLRSANGTVQVITQDDPAFPDGMVDVTDDTELNLSWHNDVETVPTVVLVKDGVEVERTVGWDRPSWEAVTGVGELGPELPDQRPGCGSLSVDPSNADALKVRFGGSVLHSRRVEIAALEDEIEALYDRGWSDGLPLVPPTEARVMRMLEGTTRDPQDIVAVIPPDLVETTVEKIAINTVMAGCKPEYLPVVLAAIEAACTDEFNMHGLLCTTMGVGPIIIVNGPIRREIGMNSGMNVFGQGNRANSTIGRALQLTVRNVGGGRPGEVDRAAHGQPGKVGLCFPEDEEGSPWESMAVERGFSPESSTVTLFAGEAPRIIVDQASRSPESLTALLAQGLMATVSPRAVMFNDAILVLTPEHMARYRDAGWSKARFRQELNRCLTVSGASITRGVDGIEAGLPPGFEEKQLSKFNPDGGLLIAHAGGPAGLFSSVIGGWLNGTMGSMPVTREIMR